VLNGNLFAEVSEVFAGQATMTFSFVVFFLLFKAGRSDTLVLCKEDSTENG